VHQKRRKSGKNWASWPQLKHVKNAFRAPEAEKTTFSQSFRFFSRATVCAVMNLTLKNFCEKVVKNVVCQKKNAFLITKHVSAHIFLRKHRFAPFACETLQMLGN
jgi:hypothetical protein